MPKLTEAIPCVHYVGFRDDRYWNAFRIWGGPAFIHRWWDRRAAREISDNDTVIFANGDWTQPPSKFNAPDIDEDAALRALGQNDERKG